MDQDHHDNAAGTNEAGDAWHAMLADQLAHELTANKAIKAFTINSALTGAYAEAVVRQMIGRTAAPLRVSRGGIIHPHNSPTWTRQYAPDTRAAAVGELDAIIWSPNPVPALFEVGDFALVPRGSAFAYLEIKRTNYGKINRSNSAAENIKARLDQETELLKVGVISPTINSVHWEPKRRSLGVVCIRDKAKDDDLDALVRDGQAVVLLEKHRRSYTANRPGIVTLIDFLAEVRLWARLVEGCTRLK